jgi:hypothetical protein
VQAVVHEVSTPDIQRNSLQELKHKCLAKVFAEEGKRKETTGEKIK